MVHQRGPREKNHLIRVQSVHQFLLCLASCTLLISCVGVWKALTGLERHILETDIAQISNRRSSIARLHENDDAKTTLPPNNGHRYLVFHGSGSSQGAGNVMQGLLAAQLLGAEFNRTVCVVWPEFMEAFEYAQQESHAKLCAGAKDWETSYTFTIWNFISSRVDECKMKGILSKEENIVVGYSGNTYPGWRSDIPPNFFHQHYRAKSELLNMLPYTNDKAPSVVVHLRSPDNSGDKNRGLDEESLKTLGNLLPGNETYLVTNRPDWYHRFHDCCGWSYDTNWVDKPIEHVALELSWRPDGTRSKEKGHTTSASSQNLKLWSDWYTILNAKTIYHSPSDFSRSAIHWNPHITGFELHGMKKLKGRSQKANRRELNLKLTYDSMSRIPPLIERQEPDSLRDDEACVFLRFCLKYSDDINSNDRNRRNKNPRTKLTGQIDVLMEKLQSSNKP